MAWIESHDNVWEHYKTIKLCSILEINRAHAVGILHGLWHFVLRNAWKDANLEPWGDAEIERAVFWDGEKGALTSGLREAGFLDGFVVHDWSERAGRLVEDRLRNEKRRKTAVKRRSNGGKSLATQPNPTQPNPTLPKHTQPRFEIPPKLEDVVAYCKERKSSVEPAYFMDYNNARGWMMGKSKMKDWQATIRTWEKNNGSYQNNKSNDIRPKPEPGKYDGITKTFNV